MHLMLCRALLTENAAGVIHVDGLVNIDSGEIYSLSAIISLRETIYVDDLSVLFPALVKVLLFAGYTNVAKAPRRMQFISGASNGSAAYVLTGDGLEVIDFKAKFGQSMPELDEAKHLINYARKMRRDKRTVGSDAYAEFLRTLHRPKENEFANYGLAREIMPKLDISFRRAKQAVTGYQYAREGNYSSAFAYDISSSYPAAALGDLPYKQPTIIEGAARPSGNHWNIYHFSYFGKDLKPGHIDWHRTPSEGYDVLTQRLFEVLQEDYTFDRIVVSKTISFRTRKSFLERFYASTVVRGKFSEDRPYIKAYNKAIGNALVGMFGRNAKSSIDTYALEGEKVVCKPQSLRLDELYCPIYLCVLDRAKSRHLRALRYIGADNLIYANTDSAFTRRPIDLERLNFGIASEAKLGRWRLQYEFDDLCIRGINAYAGHTVHDEYVNTLAGVPLTHRITVDEFRNASYTYTLRVLNDDFEIVNVRIGHDHDA